MLLTSPDIAARKAHLRLEMKARRALLDESARARAAWLLGDILEDWLRTRTESRIAIYLARPFEICLDTVGRELLRAGKTVCAPRVDVAAGRMSFWRLNDIDATESGAWGVREPISDEIVAPELAIVPGLAFDQIGNRLGTGGGWYDRVLADIPVKIGVTFGGQIVERVPVEAHDIGMDWVASEMGLDAC